MDVKIAVPSEKWSLEEVGEEVTCEFTQKVSGGGEEEEGEEEKKKLMGISQSATFSSMVNLVELGEGGEEEENGGRRVVPIMGSGRGECTVKVGGGVEETEGVKITFGKVGGKVVVPVHELRRGGEGGGGGTHLVVGKGKVLGAVTMSYKVVLRGGLW